MPSNTISIVLIMSFISDERLLKVLMTPLGLPSLGWRIHRDDKGLTYEHAFHCNSTNP
jgi:hypothetical protein